MPVQTRRDFLRLMGAGTAAVMGAGLAGSVPARRPNVLFILIDDLGWMDTTPYGSEFYDTPSIASLAQRSMLFTDAYSASPLCSPTRAGILTGLYPARLGITTPAGHLPPLPDDADLLPKTGPPWRRVITPESRRHLPLEQYTIAEAFRDAGYRTGFIGKWHLGQTEDYWPQHQGFEVNIGGGGYPGPPSYFSPYRIKSLPDGPEGEYIADRLTDEALGYLEANRGDPFFLCLWHYSVHAPYQSKDSYVAAHAGRTDPRGRQDNPVMAGMIRSMDESIGRVLAKLDELGIADDTIVVFSSDNGGNEYDRVGERQWRPTNNDPLRSGKGAIYEGGVRVPLLVCLPGVVEPGSRCEEPVSSIDFYPTLLELAGLQAAEGKTLDGESLVPLLRREGGLRREALFCHMPHLVNAATGVIAPPASTVRRGDWKLIRFYDTEEGWPDEFELYNLKHDIGEQENLAGRMPEKVRELDALIDGFLAETGALVPRRNPAYDPEALAVVDGWRASGQAKLLRGEGFLRIVSLGGDPFVWTQEVPQAGGRLVARFRMRSDSAGIGQFFWADGRTPQFGPPVRLDFAPVHDGEWHEYAVEFTADGPLRQIRIDPSTAPGQIDLDRVRLCDGAGQELKAWEFGE